VWSGPPDADDPQSAFQSELADSPLARAAEETGLLTRLHGHNEIDRVALSRAQESWLAGRVRVKARAAGTDVTQRRDHMPGHG
jgi:hypothetical protein